jgi:hypothetical protein
MVFRGRLRAIQYLAHLARQPVGREALADTSTAASCPTATAWAQRCARRFWAVALSVHSNPHRVHSQRIVRLRRWGFTSARRVHTPCAPHAAQPDLGIFLLAAPARIVHLDGCVAKIKYAARNRDSPACNLDGCECVCLLAPEPDRCRRRVTSRRGLQAARAGRVVKTAWEVSDDRGEAAACQSQLRNSSKCGEKFAGRRFHKRENPAQTPAHQLALSLPGRRRRVL